MRQSSELVKRLAGEDYTRVIQDLTELLQSAIIKRGGMYQGATGDGGYGFFLERSFRVANGKTNTLLTDCIEAALDISREYRKCLETWIHLLHSENFEGNELGLGIAYGLVRRASFVPTTKYELPPEYAVVGSSPRTINSKAVDLANAAKWSTVSGWAEKEQSLGKWTQLENYGGLSFGHSNMTTILIDLETLPETWEWSASLDKRAVFLQRSDVDTLVPSGGKRGVLGSYGLLVQKEEDF
jgi:hypothetical protein